MKKIKKGIKFVIEKFKRGFTLIELLITIAIIGILASVVLVSVANSKERANTVVAKSTAKSIMNDLSPCQGVLAPADVSLGGGPICISDPDNPDSSTPTWPTLEKTGYVYNVIADDDTKDHNFSFTLVKDSRPTIIASLVAGGISVQEETSEEISSMKSLSGNIAYANLANSPMNNVTITLKQKGITMYTTTTPGTGSGDYNFPTVAPGTYDVYFSKSENPVGINSTDAAQLNSWMTSQSSFGGIRVLAGDVYQNSPSSVITSEDVSSITSYFLTQGSLAFSGGKWVFVKNENKDTAYSNFPIPFATSNDFSNISITISNSDIIQNFTSLAFGDINKSGGILPPSPPPVSPS